MADLISFSHSEVIHFSIGLLFVSGISIFNAKLSGSQE